MNYEVAADKKFPQSWRVEAIDFDGDGDCFVTVFDGPDAEKRAREYAAWKESGAAQEVSPPSLRAHEEAMIKHIETAVEDGCVCGLCEMCREVYERMDGFRAEGDTRELKAALKGAEKIMLGLIDKSTNRESVIREAQRAMVRWRVLAG